MPLPDQFIHCYVEPYYESSCRVCARTVGMAKLEIQLVRNENNHACDPHIVAMLRKHGVDPEILLKRLGKL